MIEQPVLREIGASGRWRLEREWECRVQGTLLILPAGVVTDLASVPGGLHWLIDDDALGCAAPLVHDVLYAHVGELPVDWLAVYRTFTRREADDALRDLAVQSGASRWRALAAYCAVRIFAGAAWKKKV